MTATAEATSEFDTAADELVRPERDRWDRPLLLDQAGKRVPYTRMSTLAGYIGDSTALDKWQKRLIALGLGRRPDLGAMLAALPPIVSDLAGSNPTAAQKRADQAVKREIDEILSRAFEAAQGHVKADWGTAVHSFIEHGTDPALIERMTADVEAANAKLDRFHIRYSEMFVVNDHLGTAGSLDHIVAPKDGSHLPRVLDVKTGTLHYDQHPIQLAGYAGATPYDVYSDERGAPLPGWVDQQTAYVLHVPAGQGKADLYEVNLEVGRRGGDCAAWVRGYRSASRSYMRKVA